MAIANQQSGPNPSKEWELLCRVSELENGEATRIEIGDLKLSASKIKQSIYVVSDMCTHANYSLSDGPLHAEDLTIECWKHGAQFAYQRCALTLPATRLSDTFPTEVHGENVYIHLPRKGNNE